MDDVIEMGRSAAKHGLKEATFFPGNCFDQGHGMPQSFKEAVCWYRKAADLP